MSVSLKEVLSGSVEEVQVHRSTTKERPTEEVRLQSVSRESTQHTKSQKDPTDDLIELTGDAPIIEGYDGYLVYCKDTAQIWYAPTKQCLDANFIYRDDLEILNMDGKENEVRVWYETRWFAHDHGVKPSRKCYILDNPCNESYEVYYDSNYPSLKYGKATPKGCFIHCYSNRFHRDMAILELDDLYTNSSLKAAVNLTKKKLNAHDAIIVSDGAWMKESCASACFYIDNKSVVKLTQGFCPSEPDQAVLISELTAAYNAISLCKANMKTNIRFYYDNTSILNCFRNRKTEYIDEVRRYKALLNELDEAGFIIEFIELHPKTGEERELDNRALQYFHNRCDQECREMADIFAKDYKEFATQDTKEGKTYKQFRQETAPKKKPQGGNKPTSYNSQGQRRYGGFNAYK